MKLKLTILEQPSRSDVNESQSNSPSNKNKIHSSIGFQNGWLENPVNEFISYPDQAEVNDHARSRHRHIETN
jgi:hypothetical protein